MFVKEVYDDELEIKLDENLNIFALQNGVFDLTTMKFRRTEPQDYAMTNGGLKYDKEESDKYMGCC